MADWYWDGTAYYSVKNPQLCLETVCMLNPPTFLSTEVGPVGHDCEEAVGEIYSRRLDPADIPLQKC